MFEQSFVQTQAATRRPWTVALSLSLQAIAVGIVLLIPLLHPAMMRIPDVPKAPLIRTWANLTALPQRVATNAPATPSPIRVPRVYFAPAFVPQTPAVRDVAIPAGDIFPGWQGEPATVASGGIPGVVSLPPTPAPVKPATAPMPARPVGPVRVGGDVESARLTFSPHPTYPQIAIAARAQGTVRLEAIIGADGRIRNLRVLSGSPLLVKAAVDAVAQWKYQPTLLNGAAVEVVTEIEVNFTLSH
ncbi:MAG TPA: TonB family protein [Bryobacteraceae bacterium]|nr:TonB family protein [Bryobacteraceae bacterium]